MGFTLVAGTSALYLVSSDGTIRTLTLPAGVNIGSSRTRSAAMNSVVVLVNGPSQPIYVDALGAVRPLSLQKPVNAPALTDGGSTGYTGTRRAKLQHLIKDADGNIISASPLSDASQPVTVANKKISYGSLAISPNPLVNARRIYVTADNGTEYFAVADVDDNTTLTLLDNTSDEAIDFFSAPTDLFASPQRLDLIAEYRGRLVARSPADVDTLYMSAPDKHYAWPTTIPVRPLGADPYGITGFMARRTELGVCRRGLIRKLVGTDEDSFELITLVEGTGNIAPDVPRVIKDIGYFMDADGVYSWSNEGVKSITDATVYPWFNTDTYFNRAMFPYAFSGFNPQKTSLVIFLCAAGGTTVNRWIEYEIETGRWMGPHKTGAFTPTACGVGQDSNGNDILVVSGSDGFLYYPVVGGTASDGLTTAIEFDVLVNPHCGDPPNPDEFHFFGRCSIFTKYQASGTLSVIPYVGDLTASAGATISHSLALEREVLRILGTGRLLQMQFTKTDAGVDIPGIYGYKFPWHSLGVR